MSEQETLQLCNELPSFEVKDKVTSTRFIYYSKVADTLRDLSQLDIPIANLYDRYQVQPSL
jgi:hypothetical protein